MSIHARATLLVTIGLFLVACRGAETYHRFTGGVTPRPQVDAGGGTGGGTDAGGGTGGKTDAGGGSGGAIDAPKDLGVDKGNPVCVDASSGTPCGEVSCSNGTWSPAPTCDGLGACKTGTAQTCTPFACNATGCLSSCTTTSECSGGFACGDAGACVAPQIAAVLCDKCSLRSDKQQFTANFGIKNPGTTPINLAGITVRFWYKKTAAGAATCFYAPNSCGGSSNMKLSFGTASTWDYMEIAFTSGTLAAGEMKEPWQIGLSQAGWVAFDTTTGWSYHDGACDCTKITVYMGGQLVWGTEPS